MKNERGITLIALIVYIILMTFVVAGVTAITNSFYNNINEVDKTSESAVSFAKFNMYFINDIKTENVQIVNSSSNQVQISFKNKDGQDETVKYSFQNKALYRSSNMPTTTGGTKIKICDKVNDANFTVNTSTNTVTIKLLINNYEKTTVYSLEPEI